MADQVSVSIPTALRPQVGDQATIDVAGATVGEALGKISSDFPDFGKKLYNEQSQINRFINVYVNDEDIRFLENLDTPIKAGDDVSIVPAIAGG